MKLLGKRILTLIMTLSMLLTLCPMALADSASDFKDANGKNNVFAVEPGTIYTIKAADVGKLARFSFAKPADYDSRNDTDKDRTEYYAAVRAKDGPDKTSIHYVPLKEVEDKLTLEYFQYKASKFEVQLVKALPRGGSSEINDFVPAKIEYNDGTDSYPIKFSATLTMSETMAKIADTCYQLNIYPMQFIEFWSHIRFNFAYDMTACQNALNSIIVNGITSDIFVIDAIQSGRDGYKTRCVPAPDDNTKCIGFDIKCILKPEFYENKTSDFWSKNHGETALDKLQSEMKYEGQIKLPKADIKQALDANTNLYFYGWNSIVNAPTVADSRVESVRDDGKSISIGDVNVPALAQKIVVTREPRNLIVHVKGGMGNTQDNLQGATITIKNESGAQVETQSADASGNYTFNLPYGTYTVEASYSEVGSTPYSGSTTCLFYDDPKLGGDVECTVLINWPKVPDGKKATVETKVLSEPGNNINRAQQPVNSSTVGSVTARIVDENYLKNEKELKSTKNESYGSVQDPISLSDAYEKFSKDVGAEGDKYKAMNVKVKLNVTKISDPEIEKSRGEPVYEIIQKADKLYPKYESVDTKVNEPVLTSGKAQLVIPSYIEALIDENIWFKEWDSVAQNILIYDTEFEDAIHDTVRDTWYGSLPQHRDYLVSFTIPVPEKLETMLKENGRTVNDIKVFRFHEESTTETQPTIELPRGQSKKTAQGEYYDVRTLRDGDGNELNYVDITARFYSVFGFGFELGNLDGTTPTGGGGGTPVVPPPVVPTGTAELNKVDHYGYIIGYPVDYWTGEKTNDQPKMPVRPERNITRAEVATIYFRMLTEASRDKLWSQENSFSDVPSDAWYNAAVSTLANGGILNGDPNGKFRPDDPITRAEFASIAVRFFGGEYTGADRFSDIAGHWANTNINVASDVGLINGYPDGTFGPNKNILRCEAIAIVNRTLDRHPVVEHFLPDMLVWPDNMDTSKWYYADMQEATNSHDYKMQGSGDSKYEIWTKMLPIRNWSALEKEWSDSHSAGTGGGEVVNTTK